MKIIIININLISTFLKQEEEVLTQEEEVEVQVAEASRGTRITRSSKVIIPEKRDHPQRKRVQIKHLSSASWDKSKRRKVSVSSDVEKFNDYVTSHEGLVTNL